MAAKGKRIGRQTPTKSFVLPYEKSLYKEAVALYNKTGRKAMEWQSLLLKDMMAINDDGLWTHMTVGYSIPRRNGKAESVCVHDDVQVCRNQLYIACENHFILWNTREV